MPCLARLLISACVFFFQAEDGIRDWSVTGVQTCALPISDQHERPPAEPLGAREPMRALHGPRTIASSERGAALVMTLLVLVILSAFSMTLGAQGTGEVDMCSIWREYSKDFYAAEPALESCVEVLRNLVP